jgi:hypothetical protein
MPPRRLPVILKLIGVACHQTHFSNQVAHLFADPRSAPERTGLPPPISGKTHSMPTHDSLGPDDGYGVKNARAATIEPDEQSAVGPTQMQAAWRALLQNIELMAQDQVFGFQPPSRLEAVTQQADEKEANSDHQPQSCSDSLAAVTPADGVFGSDRPLSTSTALSKSLRDAEVAAVRRLARRLQQVGQGDPGSESQGRW